jgi:hypothetical protein
MNDKEIILGAINKLIKYDPSFAQNIKKLSELAEKSPIIYREAVKKLNSL